MELRADRFERQLAAEPLRPVYLIAGSEPIIVQEFADALRAKARAEGYSEREVLDASPRDFDWNSLSMGVASMSLFATQRLFDLRLPSGKPDRDGSKAIIDYCQSPAPDTVLMITTQEWAKKSVGKWTEAIARVGHVVTVWPVKPNELNEWLEKRLRSRGLSAEPAALQLLADRIEGNLLAAAQEVEKLALLAPGSRLDAARMERLVADSSRYDVFKLVESALAGEVSRCARMLRSLRGEGEQVPGLVPILAMELLKVANIARVADSGGNVAAAMTQMHVWDTRQAVYRRALARHPVGRWEEMVAEAGRIDLIAKGRLAGDPWLALERLLAVIAEPRARILLAS